MTTSHHTDGQRPLVLEPGDLARVEAVPLSERDLPLSTYDLLARAAQQFGDLPALHLLGEGERPWREAEAKSYAQLFEDVIRAANLFTSLGAEPGDAIGLMLPSSGSMYTALLAAQAVGIANPVNPMLSEDHIEEILTLTRAQILVAAGPDLAPEVWEKAKRIASRLPGLRALLGVGVARSFPPGGLFAGDFVRLAAEQPGDRLQTPYRPGRENLAAYFHTGGTTGTPKVAPHTHANEVYMAWVLGCSGAFLEDSVVLSGLPLFHVNAVHVTGLAPFLHGRPVVSLGPLGYRDKALMADFWRIIEHYRVTSFTGVPTVYASLPPVPDDVDISCLRAGTVGAAPLPSKVRATFETSAKVPLREGYGLTEATCATSYSPVLAPRAGSVGLRCAYQQVKAVKLDANEAPAGDCLPGESGVLAIKGPSVFPGYLRPGPEGPVPDPTGKIFDGWLLTGDLGRVDEDGYLYLTGRAKDLVIRGGHNIDPRPIEDSLLAHPDVTAAAVVGGPDAHSGEVPVAYVTVTDGAPVTSEQLKMWAAGHAHEPAAAPKAVHIVDVLPLTQIGKVYKPELVADAVRRVVLTHLREAGLDGSVEVEIVAGRPRALIHADGITAAFIAQLERYAFDYVVG